MKLLLNLYVYIVDDCCLCICISWLRCYWYLFVGDLLISGVMSMFCFIDYCEKLFVLYVLNLLLKDELILCDCWFWIWNYGCVIYGVGVWRKFFMVVEGNLLRVLLWGVSLKCIWFWCFMVYIVSLRYMGVFKVFLIFIVLCIVL